jgi:7-cyano-7-deazaguanine synthase in queuosine biosynthesis
MTTKVLLYSGGMDSLCLAHLWQPDVLLYANMGTPYAEAEMDRLPQDDRLHVVDLPVQEFARPDAIIPLRNLLLVCLGAQYGQDGDGVAVALAATAGDRILDKSDEFAARASTLLTWLWQPQHWTVGKDVHVVLPAKTMTKAALVRQYMADWGDTGALLASLSCYSPTPDGVGCGACKSCARRWVALEHNGLRGSVPDCRDYVREHVYPAAAAGTSGRGRAEDAEVLAVMLSR